MTKLVEDFFNMKEEILSRDFDLGFSGDSEDVVMRALHLLEKCINVTGSANRNGEFTIAACQTVPALFELNFYSNGLFHVFIPDAIIGMMTQLFLLVSLGCSFYICGGFLNAFFVSSLQHPVTAARSHHRVSSPAQGLQQPSAQSGASHPQGGRSLPLPDQRGGGGISKSSTWIALLEILHFPI